MGALIFLLLVTTRHIRSDARTQSQATSSPPELTALGQHAFSAMRKLEPPPAPLPAPQPELLSAAGAMPLPRVDLPDLPLVAPLTPPARQPPSTNNASASLRDGLRDDKRKLQESRSDLEATLSQVLESQAQLADLKHKSDTTRTQTGKHNSRRKLLRDAIENLKRQNVWHCVFFLRNTQFAPRPPIAQRAKQQGNSGGVHKSKCCAHGTRKWQVSPHLQT